jgi:glycosyltransferase involved in cell wall biosynthesis
MRILHVVPTYLPATRYGGPIYAVHGLAKALAAAGHEVSVFTTNVDGGTVSGVPLNAAVMRDGVSVRYFASPMPRLYWSPAMRAALRREARGFDVVHLHSVFLWPTMAGAAAARRAGVPYVISPRGMLVPELIRRRSRLIKTSWIRLVERGNFRHAAAIHFTSRREWDDAARLAIPLPSPFVIANGIDLEEVRVADSRSDYVLFLGRINWKKGLERLIEALAGVPNVRAIVAGNDEEHYTAQLQALAGRFGVLERIEFTGPVSGEAKRELLANAAVLVLPSHNENFGNVVIEAMGSGVPVIVTPEVGLSDAVLRAGAGLITSGEPEDLARSIHDLVSNPALARELGTRGRELVEREYTWPVIAAQMIQAYEAVISSQGSGGSARGS